MSIPHYKISYAQNYEDLILSGLLRDVENGFYIDVGANHPELDSVTKLFYDRGWSGINIEPNDFLHAKLVHQRPRDVNLSLGVASQAGKLKFRSYETLDGLSTFAVEAMESVAMAWPDAKYVDKFIDVVTLGEIFAKHRPTGDVHFLKIDVEGLELEALLGNKWHLYRPWILCVEEPHDTQDDIARRVAISACLKVWDYSKVFSDGINDYFIAVEHLSLWEKFSYARDVLLNGVCVNYIFINYINELKRKIENE
jgi:FkbM family methyltransferase